jgi:hypothetical protein
VVPEFRVRLTAKGIVVVKPRPATKKGERKPREKKPEQPKPEVWRTPTNIIDLTTLIQVEGTRHDHRERSEYWYQWPIIVHMPAIKRLMARAGWETLKAPQAKGMAVFVDPPNRRSIGIFDGEFCLEEFETEREWERALEVWSRCDGKALPFWRAQKPKSSVQPENSVLCIGGDQTS